MNIEEAIKQTKPFKSKEQKLAVNLMYTSNWLEHKMKDFLKGYQLTLKQYNILRILNGAEQAVSVAFIRERLLDKVSDVSRIVDRMDHKGIIQKKTNVRDKRLVDIILTDRGKSLLKNVSTNFDKMDQILSSLNKKEMEALNQLLDKLRTENF